MPIDIKIHTTGGEVIEVAWNDQWSQDFFFEVDDPVTDVEFDPGNWILKYVSEVSPPATGVDGRPSVLALSAPAAVEGGVEITYSVPAAGHVELAVFDVAGRRVATLVDGDTPAGTHAAVWSGTSAGGEAVASGVYFARLSSAEDAVSRKVLFVK
jgi:hypothetical protein